MGTERIISLDVADRARALQRVPLLRDCPEDELRTIAEHSHLLTFDAGDVIVPEGEEGLGFYVILAGGVRVVVQAREIAVLGAGEFFGEVALLEGGPRTATVVAVERTTCLGILRSHFRPMLVRNPRLALSILEEEQRRLDQVRGTP